MREIPSFGITISPPHRRGKPKDLLSVDTICMRQLLNRVSKDYTLYPEFDYQSRLHYHGMISFKDMLKWHKSVKHRMTQEIGFVKLERFKNTKEKTRWENYMMKDYIKGKSYPPIKYEPLRRPKQSDSSEQL